MQSEARKKLKDDRMRLKEAREKLHVEPTKQSVASTNQIYESRENELKKTLSELETRYKELLETLHMVWTENRSKRSELPVRVMSPELCQESKAAAVDASWNSSLALPHYQYPPPPVVASAFPDHSTILFGSDGQGSSGTGTKYLPFAMCVIIV